MMDVKEKDVPQFFSLKNVTDIVFDSGMTADDGHRFYVQALPRNKKKIDSLNGEEHCCHKEEKEKDVLGSQSDFSLDFSCLCSFFGALEAHRLGKERMAAVPGA
jgi:hypothetical protein